MEEEHPFKVKMTHKDSLRLIKVLMKLVPQGTIINEHHPDDIIQMVKNAANKVVEETQYEENAKLLKS